MHLRKFDLSSKEVVDKWKEHRAPSDVLKAELISERADTVWRHGWTHSEYRDAVDMIRLEQLRSQSISWRGNYYEKDVFDEMRRRAEPEAWVEPMDFGGACLMTRAALVADLDNAEFLPTDRRELPLWRVGLDNCGLPGRLRTAHGYGGSALEVMSVSPLRGGALVIPGLALGGETRSTMHRLLARSPLFDIMADMRQRAVITGDCHGVGTMVSRGRGDDDAGQDGYLVNGVRLEPNHCALCGLEWRTLLPGDARLGAATHPLAVTRDADSPWARWVGRVWGDDAQLASMAVRPGWWHSVSTVITRAAEAEGRLGPLLTALDGIDNAVMNGAVSITGVEAISAGDERIPVGLRTWLRDSGAAALAAAPNAAGAREALDLLHRRILARRPASWTIGCHSLYDTIGSAEQLFKGDLQAFREKPVERAHQYIKRNVHLSNYRLLRAAGRARYMWRRAV